MDNLQYIKEKYQLDLNQKSPIKLPIDKYKGFPELLNELDCKIGVEVGVREAKYSKWLCHYIKGLKLYLVDNYSLYDDFGRYADQDIQDKAYEDAKKRVAKLNCEFIKKSSMEAVKDFLDNSLDFVYVDANHNYEYVVEDIAQWSKKVKVGGIVSGHDYSNYMREVKIAVDGWVKVKRIKPLFTTGRNNWFYIK